MWLLEVWDLRVFLDWESLLFRSLDSHIPKKCLLLFQMDTVTWYLLEDLKENHFSVFSLIHWSNSVCNSSRHSWQWTAIFPFQIIHVTCNKPEYVNRIKSSHLWERRHWYMPIWVSSIFLHVWFTLVLSDYLDPIIWVTQCRDSSWHPDSGVKNVVLAVIRPQQFLDQNKHAALNRDTFITFFLL